MTHPEQQYLDLIDKITKEGHFRPSPHKALPGNDQPSGTFSLMNHNMTFDLREGYFPLMTVRQVGFKPVAAELLWFLTGSTNNHDLRSIGARFWDPWDTPDTNVAMGWAPGQLGPIYGKQWRHWGARMEKPDGSFAPVRGALAAIMRRLTGGDGTQGLDQIARLVQRIRETPNSKRLYVTAYDPIDMEDCFVTTCHGLFFCQIWGEHLNLHMIQRSGDVPVGIPFNIASYSLLMYMLAQVTNLKPGVFYHTISDAHVYEKQVPFMEELLARPPKPYPTLTLNPEVTDIFAFTLADFTVTGYDAHPKMDIPVET